MLALTTRNQAGIAILGWVFVLHAYEHVFYNVLWVVVYFQFVNI